MEFSWYKELINSYNIDLGDMIPDCPIVIPPSKIYEGDEIEIEITLIDSIILSQSCDLVNDKILIVLVCPYFTLKTFIKGLQDSDQRKRLRKKT